MENLYLIVGLGNPGAEYAKTRHNVGFQVVERLAARWQAGWAYKKKFNARVARAPRGSRQVVLCEPQTYMNSAGEAGNHCANEQRREGAHQKSIPKTRRTFTRS